MLLWAKNMSFLPPPAGPLPYLGLLFSHTVTWMGLCLLPCSASALRLVASRQDRMTDTVTLAALPPPPTVRTSLHRQPTPRRVQRATKNTK
jgi:hypothetical protein